MSAQVEGLRALPLSPAGPAPSPTPPPTVANYAAPHASNMLMPPPSQSASAAVAAATATTEESVRAAEPQQQQHHHYPYQHHHQHHHHQLPTVIDDTSAQKTPTRDSFFGTSNAGNATQTTAGQGRSPTSMTIESILPGTNASRAVTEVPTTNNKLTEAMGSANIALPSEQQTASQVETTEDVPMDDAMDDENELPSDNEDGSVTSDRPAKKKKGQRFFCTDFPPCQLSFTRSEHLARHIRKHTGERPFQCHCLRRFSRLDNLRQHAQTVHVNEEIPGNSLAATGTRFQKQVRTDRIRAPGGRHRASTIGSASGAHSRGHSRNWSNSSIGSVTSELGTPDDFRRRQQPLAMAQATPSRPMTMETYSSHSSFSEGPHSNFYNRPSSGVSTPVSSRFSSTADSPGLRSPITLMSRPVSYGDRTPSRRLSVPSTTNPFAYSPSVQYMSPLLSSTAATFPSNGNIYGSPTSTVFTDDRGESLAEAEYRRRTWHPSSNPNQAVRPATSGLGYYQTSNDASSPLPAPPPASASASASSSSQPQQVRLPGIDSFDRAYDQPVAPPRRAPSPMEVDDLSSRRSSLIDIQPETRNSRDSWGSINQHLTQLEIDHLSSIPSRREPLAWRFPSAPNTATETRATPPTISASPPSSAAAPVPNVSITHQNSGQSQNHPASVPSGIVHTSLNQPAPRLEPTIRLSDPPTTPRKKKRQAWYNGPIQSRPSDTWTSSHAHSASLPASYSTQRTSPEGSTSSEGLPTPSTAAGSDFRPAIVHSNGYIEGQMLAGTGAMVEDASKHPPARPEAAEYGALQPLTPPILASAGKLQSSSGLHNRYQTPERALPPTTTAQSRAAFPKFPLTGNPTSGAAAAAPSLSRTLHENTDRLDALVAVATEASQAPPRPGAYTSAMVTTAAPR